MAVTKPSKFKGAAKVSRKGPDHIPRPPNCFILFRRSQHLEGRVIPHAVTKAPQDVSKIASYLWNNLSTEERKYWEDQAKAAKEEHQRKYPHWKYKPEAVTAAKRKRNTDNNSPKRIRMCKVVANLVRKGVTGDALVAAIADPTVQSKMEVESELIIKEENSSSRPDGAIRSHRRQSSREKPKRAIFTQPLVPSSLERSPSTSKKTRKKPVPTSLPNDEPALEALIDNMTIKSPKLAVAVVKREERHASTSILQHRYPSLSPSLSPAPSRSPSHYSVSPPPYPYAGSEGSSYAPSSSDGPSPVTSPYPTPAPTPSSSPRPGPSPPSPSPPSPAPPQQSPHFSPALSFSADEVEEGWDVQESQYSEDMSADTVTQSIRHFSPSPSPAPEPVYPQVVYEATVYTVPAAAAVAAPHHHHHPVVISLGDIEGNGIAEPSAGTCVVTLTPLQTNTYDAASMIPFQVGGGWAQAQAQYEVEQTLFGHQWAQAPAFTLADMNGYEGNAMDF
ncbi:hypothetical protein SISNIDRAFT_461480 [Sistotremastrum niveocremeum HHB9708]|uniref:HMG box domain-containing protein n=1 Tax=Sistotremastrum niveocremeum HHB9708 TaxID=1314777 RepID=A0A164ML13_9AGAM|nr:hypothetical protein SISNIDRAFT_461480 [Sistotremastrum niveocremeum HHB9708]